MKPEIESAVRTVKRAKQQNPLNMIYPLRSVTSQLHSLLKSWRSQADDKQVLSVLSDRLLIRVLTLHHLILVIKF